MTAQKIGVISRIDYGSNGFRRGLLGEAGAIFEREGVKIVIVAGGLVSKDLNKQVPKKAKERQEFLRKTVDELKNGFPKLVCPDGKRMKWFIVTSPSYDKSLGREIALELAKSRPDINCVEDKNYYFYVKNGFHGFNIMVLTPSKGNPFTGKYFSTHAQRLIERETKRAGRKVDLYIVGCYGSAISKPKGESSVPYMVVPALHRLDHDAGTLENQVGALVLSVDFSEDEKEKPGHKVAVYDMRDLILNDREFIVVPEEVKKQIGEVGVQILETIRKNGKLTAGRISDWTGLTKKDVLTTLKIMPDGNDIWPGLSFNSNTGEYDFDLKWVQTNLRYDFYTETGWKSKQCLLQKDVIVSFGCLHAGCVTTDYDFFLKDLPGFLVKNNARYLFGVGDFVEGLKHNLMLRGAIYGGFNLTLQEKLAAGFVGEVLKRVFVARKENDSRLKKISSMNLEEVKNVVDEWLLYFHFIPGNHCCWSEEVGFSALDTFESCLRQYVLDFLNDFLREFGGFVDSGEIVKNHIARGGEFIVSSGLKVKLMHPWMARTLTHSNRAQQANDFAPEAQIVCTANYHTAVAVCEFDRETGQRISLQAGTIKHSSDFEDNKLKIVDQGVVCAGVVSFEGRILMVEIEFYGREKGIVLNNEDIFREFLEKQGIKNIWV